MNSPPAVPTFAYVGCFTTVGRKGRGKGISVYRIDQITGSWDLVQVSEALNNPGFLILDRDQKFLYVAHGSNTDNDHKLPNTDQVEDSQVSAYSIDRQSGKLQLLNWQLSGGDNSGHLAIDPTNRYVVVANGPGIATFPINKDGSLGPLCDIDIPSGELGPYRREQGGSHPHQIVFDLTGRFLLVPDKGLDQVHVYQLDASNGKLITNDTACVKSRYGAGPRHITLHPTRPFAYAVNELNSTVTAYHWHSDRGELNPFQIVPTTPTTFTGNNISAEISIAPSGNFLYVSNRGHHSIVTFAIDADNGTLNPIGWELIQGKRPRFFTLDSSGSRLYVANQDSDSIVVFRIDGKTGQPVPTGQVVQTSSPACIVFSYH